MNEVCGLCEEKLDMGRVELENGCKHRFHEFCLLEVMMGDLKGLPRYDGTGRPFRHECPVCKEKFTLYKNLRDPPTKEQLEEIRKEEAKKCEKVMQRKLEKEKEKIFERAMVVCMQQQILDNREVIAEAVRRAVRQDRDERGKLNGAGVEAIVDEVLER